jgi:hypothetical protein
LFIGRRKCGLKDQVFSLGIYGFTEVIRISDCARFISGSMPTEFRCKWLSDSTCKITCI